MALRAEVAIKESHSSYDHLAPRQVGRQVGGHGVEQERALVLEEAVTFTSISMRGSPFGTADLGGPHDIVRTLGVIASGDNPLYLGGTVPARVHGRPKDQPTPAAIKVRRRPWEPVQCPAGLGQTGGRPRQVSLSTGRRT
jgi:hypothetical protein